MKALVSVCITTFNRRESLRKALVSVLEQDYINLEVIIVDDCSTDGTQYLVKNELLQLDDRIIYLRHDFNKGLSAARNTALQVAKGKYFTFVDDDDVWKKSFLSKFIEMANNDNQEYVYCASIISKQDIVSIKGPLISFLKLGYTPPVASQFYSLSSLKVVKGYNENIRSGVDHDLWISLGAFGHQIKWLNQNLVNVNDTFDTNRMTNNYHNRISGVFNSIKIWEENYKQEFGIDFFKSLRLNYSYHTHKSFLKKTFHISKLQAVKFLFRLPVSLIFWDVWRFIKIRLGFASVLIQPTFISCLSNSKKSNLMKEIEIKRAKQ